MSSFMNLPASYFGQAHWRTALKQRWIREQENLYRAERKSSNIPASTGTGSIVEGHTRPANKGKMHHRVILKKKYRKEREELVAIQHSPPHESALETRVFTLDDKYKSPSTTTNLTDVSHRGHLPLRGIRRSERIKESKKTPQP